jgi:hypothetical protein
LSPQNFSITGIYGLPLNFFRTGKLVKDNTGIFELHASKIENAKMKRENG